MNRYRLFDCETGATIGFVKRAYGTLDRTFGLLGTRRVPSGRGMWFDACGAVHTLFMGCAIDVVFLDRDSRIVKIAANVPPNRVVASAKGATTVELGAGTAERAGLRCGDRIALEEG